jgi:hypothetical protein
MPPWGIIGEYHMTNQKNDVQKETVVTDAPKNVRAILKLKSELSFLDEKIREGEVHLQEAKDTMERYQGLTMKIVDLNKKMKLSLNVPFSIKKDFEDMVKEAELLEKKLNLMGISSEEDYHKVSKSLKDKRQLLEKYTEMIVNLEKHEQYARQDMPPILEQKTKTVEKNLLKDSLIELNQMYGIVLESFQDLLFEIKKTEDKIKGLLITQKIQKELSENLKVVEKSMLAFEKAIRLQRELDDKILDKDGYLKNPRQKDSYFKQSRVLKEDLRLNYEVLYENQISNKEDFYVKDKNNKEEIQRISSELEEFNTKMRMLKEIYEACKSMK